MYDRRGLEFFARLNIHRVCVFICCGKKKSRDFPKRENFDKFYII